MAADIASFSVDNTGTPRAPCMNRSLLIEVKLYTCTTLFDSTTTELATCSRLLKFIMHIPVLLHLGAYIIGLLFLHTIILYLSASVKYLSLYNFSSKTNAVFLLSGQT